MSRIILIAVLLLVIWAVFFLPPPLDTEDVETPQVEPTRGAEPQQQPTILPITGTHLGREATATPWIAVAIGKVNFRSSCSTGANILTVVLPGQKVRVLDHASRGWVPVEYDNMYGCLMSACIGLEDGVCQ